MAFGEGSSGASVTENVRLVDVSIVRSGGYGASLLELAAFSADSREVAIRDGGRPSAPFPLRAEPGALHRIPTSLALSGNERAEIEIVSGNTAMPSDTIPDRGYPYQVSGRLRVAPPVNGEPSTLTIEPGVTLRFATTSDSGLHFGSSNRREGLIVAVGTPERPIMFTSSNPRPDPGDGKNLHFAYSPARGNRIEHAVVEFAGGFSGAQGYGCGPLEKDASVLLLAGRLEEGFIRHTLFRHGGGDTGIVLGWSSDEDGPDFRSTNAFVDMPPCHVSRWQNAMGIPCPEGRPTCL